MTPQQFQQWRIDHDYTQAEIAEVLGVHYRTISKWEIGARKIPPFMHITLRCVNEKGGVQNTEGIQRKEVKKKAHGRKDSNSKKDR
ncbi:MAG: helix-turn-helix transcriptional regulator [Nitrospirae bacterium]|nr:helix-turn-helix transcriptional regulator [Nitrospirota bacterium]